MPGPFTPDPLGAAWPATFPWLSFGFAGGLPGFSLDTVAGPAEEPVDAAAAKKQTRIDYADEDALYALWVPAARQLVEQEAATVLVQQTLKLGLPGWPADGQVRLPVGPVSAVSAVTYYAADGTLTPLTAGTHYQTWLGYRPPLVLPAPNQYWPAVQFGKVPAVEVTFVAGYADAASVPALAKQAVLQTLAYWAANRGDEEAPRKYGLSEGARRSIRLLRGTGYR